MFVNHLSAKRRDRASSVRLKSICPSVRIVKLTAHSDSLLNTLRHGIEEALSCCLALFDMELENRYRAAWHFRLDFWKSQ